MFLPRLHLAPRLLSRHCDNSAAPLIELPNGGRFRHRVRQVRPADVCNPNCQRRTLELSVPAGLDRGVSLDVAPTRCAVHAIAPHFGSSRSTALSILGLRCREGDSPLALSSPKDGPTNRPGLQSRSVPPHARDSERLPRPEAPSTERARPGGRANTGRHRWRRRIPGVCSPADVETPSG